MDFELQPLEIILMLLHFKESVPKKQKQKTLVILSPVSCFPPVFCVSSLRYNSSVVTTRQLYHNWKLTNQNIRINSTHTCELYVGRLRFSDNRLFFFLFVQSKIQRSEQQIHSACHNQFWTLGASAEYIHFEDMFILMEMSMDTILFFFSAGYDLSVWK